jgi:endoglucanase
MPGVNVPAVKVDTVGYAPTWAKKAILNAKPKQVVIFGEDEMPKLILPPSAISEFGKDAASGDPVWTADFSALTQTGRYKVQLQFEAPLTAGGVYDSDWFEIKPHPYDRALVAAQRMFYYQRTRTQLTKPYTQWDKDDDDYTRAAPSHTHADVGWVLDDYPKKLKKWPLERGWFDAGNFDMYIPSTAPSAQLLLWAYELNPAAFGDANNIPESGNKIPDILDEATWGLDWVASLQAPEGGFRAREAIMQLGEVKEGDASNDKTTRWVSGVGSASTAKAVAALATAGRVYKPFDAQRAARYGKAALKGYAWLQRHPEHRVFDGKGSDQTMWDDGKDNPDENGCRAAAAYAVWRLNGSKVAFADLQQRWGSAQLSAAGLEGGWPNIGRFAVLGILLDPEGPAAMREEAKTRLFKTVDAYKALAEKDGYRVALGPTEYFWGTPSNVMEKATLMALAARVDPVGHAWCVETARDQWHWILGRNANGYSLLTRVGKGPTRFYHLEWGKKRVPPPGFLIDGPNGSNAPFLAPGAPAKCLLWFSPKDLKSGVKAGDPFHNDQQDLWDGGFIPNGSWDNGWWVVTEVDLYYNAALVQAAALIAP